MRQKEKAGEIEGQTRAALHTLARTHTLTHHVDSLILGVDHRGTRASGASSASSRLGRLHCRLFLGFLASAQCACVRVCVCVCVCVCVLHIMCFECRPLAATNLSSHAPSPSTSLPAPLPPRSLDMGARGETPIQAHAGSHAHAQHWRGTHAWAVDAASPCSSMSHAQSHVFRLFAARRRSHPPVTVAQSPQSRISHPARRSVATQTHALAPDC